MIISARTTSDLSSLDFHVYADVDENLYAHHDLMLPAFPLCVEWLDFSPGPDASGAAPEGAKPGSYVAVGSFDPSIEIWDADLVDGLYPRAILGQSPSLENQRPSPLVPVRRSENKWCSLLPTPTTMSSPYFLFPGHPITETCSFPVLPTVLSNFGI